MHNTDIVIRIFENLSETSSSAVEVLRQLRSNYSQLLDEKNVEIAQLNQTIQRLEWEKSVQSNLIEKLSAAPLTVTHTDIPVAAVNYDELAIKSHAVNFPECISFACKNLSTADESGSGSNRKEHTKRKYKIKKERKPRINKELNTNESPTGKCLLCGEPTENAKYKFCSRSHQVKYGHQQRGHNTKPVELKETGNPQKSKN